MSTDNLDLATIRERANAAYYAQQASGGEWAGRYDSDVSALLDRIESLEAEVERLRAETGDDRECLYTFAHTRHWCGYSGCRDS